jgi:hypothetical protein
MGLRGLLYRDSYILPYHKGNCYGPFSVKLCFIKNVCSEFTKMWAS